MRNYIILNDQNSNDISGLLIQSLAPISKPLMRTEIEEIDGRDGDIITKLGYSAYDKQITIGLYGDYNINDIIAYFNSEGTVIFSNESDKYYNYKIYDQIDFERLVRYRTATVTFHVQPFKFATTGETQTLNAGNPVSAEGTNLVLEGSAEAPFSQFDLKGNTEQDTYTGKNLLDLYIDSTNPVTKNGITCTYNASDQTMTFDGTCTADNTTFRFAQNSIDFTANVTKASVYYVSGSATTYCSARFYDSSYGGLTFRIEGLNSSNPLISHTYGTSYTMQASNGSIRFNNGSVASNFKIKFMIADSEDTTYEPYTAGASPNPDYPQDIRVVTGENTIKIVGKNLFNIEGDLRQGFVSADGGLAYSAQSVVLADYIDAQPNTTYTASYDVLVDGTVLRCVCFYDADKKMIERRTNIGASSFTSPANTSFMRVYFYNAADLPLSSFSDYIRNIQIEKSSQATDYEEYHEQSYPLSLSSLELVKIGNYQDYIWNDNGTWKKHNAIGKYVYNNDLATNGLNSSRVAMVTPTLNVAPSLADDSGVFYSNMFMPTVINETGLKGTTSASKIRLQMSTSFADSYDGFRALAAANNLTIYYPLATTSDTEITDTTLIEQLNDIADHAHAYRVRTYIGSTYASGNAPHIIAATVNGDASGTVTNAGNIYSKPKLTVYGSGDIGIYLNGVQMFQIALGSDGYITIDTNLMEAYKDNLQTLKNRQVTGDYSNFKLPVGQSTISFSGIVTSCVVENFSRWL